MKRTLSCWKGISICVVVTHALELILAVNHDLRYETPKNCKTVALIKVH